MSQWKWMRSQCDAWGLVKPVTSIMSPMLSARMEVSLDLSKLENSSRRSMLRLLDTGVAASDDDERKLLNIMLSKEDRSHLEDTPYVGYIGRTNAMLYLGTAEYATEFFTDAKALLILQNPDVVRAMTIPSDKKSRININGYKIANRPATVPTSSGRRVPNQKSELAALRDLAIRALQHEEIRRVRMALAKRIESGETVTYTCHYTGE